MAYKRKTRDVVCRKCGRRNRVPAWARLAALVCARGSRGDPGGICGGPFRAYK